MSRNVTPATIKSANAALSRLRLSGRIAVANVAISSASPAIRLVRPACLSTDSVITPEVISHTKSPYEIFLAAHAKRAGKFFGRDQLDNAEADTEPTKIAR